MHSYGLRTYALTLVAAALGGARLGGGLNFDAELARANDLAEMLGEGLGIDVHASLAGHLAGEVEGSGRADDLDVLSPSRGGLGGTLSADMGSTDLEPTTSDLLSLWEGGQVPHVPASPAQDTPAFAGELEAIDEDLRRAAGVPGGPAGPTQDAPAVASGREAIAEDLRRAAEVPHVLASPTQGAPAFASGPEAIDEDLRRAPEAPLARRTRRERRSPHGGAGAAPEPASQHVLLARRTRRQHRSRHRGTGTAPKPASQHEVAAHGGHGRPPRRADRSAPTEFPAPGGDRDPTSGDRAGGEGGSMHDVAGDIFTFGGRSSNTVSLFLWFAIVFIVPWLCCCTYFGSHFVGGFDNLLTKCLYRSWFSRRRHIRFLDAAYLQ